MQEQKILLVDDEEFNLDILQEYLEDSGFLPLPARNGHALVYT